MESVNALRRPHRQTAYNVAQQKGNVVGSAARLIVSHGSADPRQWKTANEGNCEVDDPRNDQNA